MFVNKDPDIKLLFLSCRLSFNRAGFKLGPKHRILRPLDTHSLSAVINVCLLQCNFITMTI